MPSPATALAVTGLLARNTATHAIGSAKRADSFLRRHPLASAAIYSAAQASAHQQAGQSYTRLLQPGQFQIPGVTVPAGKES